MFLLGTCFVSLYVYVYNYGMIRSLALRKVQEIINVACMHTCTLLSVGFAAEVASGGASRAAEVHAETKSLSRRKWVQISSGPADHRAIDMVFVLLITISAVRTPIYYSSFNILFSIIKT